MENYDISVILRMKREALGYSRAQVCELCNYIFSEKTLYRMETGKAKMSRHTIKVLLELYKQPSHSICAVMDMESYNMYKLYNEVLHNLFLQEHAEASRKLNLLEQYARGQSEVVERLKREVEFFSNKNTENDILTLEKMEELLEHIVPKGADISKWPLLDIELESYAFFFILLIRNGNLEEKEKKLLIQLLNNIKQNYHGLEIRTDYSGVFAEYLLRIVCHEDAIILKYAEEALNADAQYGGICHTYILLFLLHRYMSKNQEEKDKADWIKKIKKAYYLSISIEDTQYANLFNSILKNNYNITLLY